MTGRKPAISDAKGHEAASPREMPLAGWKDILSRTYQRTWDDNLALVAAGVAFYGFFALLSLLAMIVLLYGLAADVQTLVGTMQALTDVLPRGAATLIGDQLVQAMKSSQEQKGVGIVIAFVVALYGGTNGASAIITALNIAYEEKEKRSLLQFYMVAIAIAFAAVIATLLALVGVAVAASLERIAPLTSPALLMAGKLLSYLLLGLTAAVAAASLYRFGPSRESARWKWITPGSVFAAGAWLLLTILFGVWVTAVSDYSKAYGSLGATVGLLTWMYLSAYVFMLGAELNSEIEHQTATDSTTGKPEPVGLRGAWAADNIANDEKVQDRPEARVGEKLTAASPQIAEEAER